MLNNESIKLDTVHGKLANHSKVTESDNLEEQALKLAIETMEKEFFKYQKAGLTNVSIWLE